VRPCRISNRGLGRKLSVSLAELVVLGSLRRDRCFKTT